MAHPFILYVISSIFIALILIVTKFITILIRIWGLSGSGFAGFVGLSESGFSGFSGFVGLFGSGFLGFGGLSESGFSGF